MGLLDKIKSIFGLDEKPAKKRTQKKKSTTKKKVKKKAVKKTSKKKKAVKKPTKKKAVKKKVAKKKKATKKTAKKKTVLKKPAKKKVVKKKVTKKKKVAKKAKSKPKVKVKKKASKDDSLQSIGVVTHYFGKVKAAIILIEDEELNVGDKILIKGEQTQIKQKVKSMQINHIPIDTAKIGEEIGLQTPKPVKVSDRVYKI